MGGGGREEVEGVSMGGQRLDSWGDGGNGKKGGKEEAENWRMKGEDQEAGKWCEHETSQRVTVMTSGRGKALEARPRGSLLGCELLPAA